MLSLFFFFQSTNFIKNELDVCNEFEEENWTDYETNMENQLRYTVKI